MDRVHLGGKIGEDPQCTGFILKVWMAQVRIIGSWSAVTAASWSVVSAALYLSGLSSLVCLPIRSPGWCCWFATFQGPNFSATEGPLCPALITSTFPMRDGTFQALLGESGAGYFRGMLYAYVSLCMYENLRGMGILGGTFTQQIHRLFLLNIGFLNCSDLIKK